MTEPAGSIPAENKTGIAITGIACSYPGIPSLKAYTEALFSGVPADYPLITGLIPRQSPEPLTRDTLRAAFNDAGLSDQLRENTKIGLLVYPTDAAICREFGNVIEIDSNSSTPESEQAANLLTSGQYDLVIWGGASKEPAAAFLVLKFLADAVHDDDRIYAIMRPDLCNSQSDAALVESIDDSPLSEQLTVIKASLALHHRIFPPSSEQGSTAKPWIHPGMQEWVRRESTAIDTGESTSESKASRRRAAIAGANGITTSPALILEEHPHTSEKQQPSALTKWDTELFIFAAQSTKLLLEPVQNLLEFLVSNNRPFDLKDLAYTVNTSGQTRSDASQNSNSCKLAIVAESKSDLEAKLALAANKILSGQQESLSIHSSQATGVYYADKTLQVAGDLSFLLPGLGAAYPHMLSDLCIHYPEVREIFDFIDQLAIEIGETDLPSTRIFSDSGNSLADSISLAQSSSAVVTVLMAEYSMFLLLQKLGIEPDTVLGCSTGEFAALTMNGCVNIVSVARLFYRLSSQVARAIPAEQAKELRSLRIVAPFEDLKQSIEALPSPVYLSAELGPAETVVSGHMAAVEELTRFLKNAGIEFQQLPLAIPYHTPLVENALQIDPAELARIPFQEPSLRSWSCSTATTYPNDTDAIRKLTTELFKRPVRLARAVESMYEEGVRTFVELGPKGTLTLFVKQILKDKPHVAIASNLPNRSALTQINQLLAVLFCQGRHMDLTYLYSRRAPHIVEMTYEPDQEKKAEPIHRQVRPDSCEGTQDVMTAYLDSITRYQSRLMQVQKNVMSAYLECENDFGQEEPYDSDRSAVQLPFLAGASIEFLQPADSASHPSVEVKKLLSLSEDLYLLDHAIGGNTTACKNSEEKVFLVPLMVSIEMMAEVANLMANTQQPSRVPVRIENVRALKRIRVGLQGYGIKVIARSLAGYPDKISVEILTDTPDRQQLASCDVWFKSEYDPAPDFNLLNLHESRPPKLAADRLYSKETMFHGPLLQSVQQLTGVGKNGLTGNVSVRRSERWFAKTSQINPAESILTDPLLLDNSSQLVLFYLFEYDLPVKALLPFHIESMEFFGPSHRLPALINAQAQLLSVGEERTRANIDISDGKGRIHVRIKGISSRRIAPPEDWADVIMDPVSTFVSKQVVGMTNTLAAPDDWACAQLDGTTLPADSALCEWLADYVLTEEEQAHLSTEIKQPRRKAEWLTGRMALKDAVRFLLKKRKNLNVAPADIKIVVSDNGALSVEGRCFQSPDEAPRVSLAHKDGIAIALAVFTRTDAGVGIDLETKREFDEHFEALALTECEKTILDELTKKSQPAVGRNEAICRIWCAKESIAKAAGSGLSNNPKTIEVIAADWSKGQLAARFVNAGEDQCYLVHTSSQNGFVIGFTVLETACQPAR